MKKIFIAVMFVSISLFLCGVVSADTTTTTTPTNAAAHKFVPPTYTADQRTCINNAMRANWAATNPATDAFNAAVKDAIATRNAAMKAIKDGRARVTAMRAVSDAFSNDSTVKQAEIPYQAALKSIKIKSTKDIIKDCTANPSGAASILNSISNLFKEATSSLLNAFNFTK